MTFNELLISEGINPNEVCVIRHNTFESGIVFSSLHDLWRKHPEGFERYQAIQETKRRIFRDRQIWAAFVKPTQNQTLFVGLFDAILADTRKAEWLCDYRGDEPGGGKPVDVFETRMRPELSGQVGILQVDWPIENVRTWARKSEGLKLPISDGQPVDPFGRTTGGSLVEGLSGLGFSVTRSTKKVVQLSRDNLGVYVKRETTKRPLVIHPRYIDLSEGLRALGCVDLPEPVRTYVNSNLRAFPAYKTDRRDSEGRHGFAIGIDALSLRKLVEYLEQGATIATPDGEVRVIAPEDDPLTERERLQAARIGQGDFRNSLVVFWKGACPVTGVDHAALLRASHIKPWRDASNAERLNPFNGLLLSAHVDALFDRQLITFDDDGRIRISSLVSPDNCIRLGLDPSMRLSGLDARHLPFLAYHRSRFQE